MCDTITAGTSKKPLYIFQIPPDLVVKFQAIDIVEVIWDPINGETSSKGRVATGNQEVSWSQHARVIGLPLNRVECGLYDQTERLFNASISFEYTGNDRRQWINMEVASQGEMWWDFKQPAQQDLFASWVELGEKFYEAIIAHPVPLDMRTLQALKSSSLALDIYAWLAYRSHRVNRDKKAVFVSWTQLHQQFGASYHDVKGFKRYAKVALHKVLAVYAHLKVEEVRGGIKINPGYPLITSR